MTQNDYWQNNPTIQQCYIFSCTESSLPIIPSFITHAHLYIVNTDKHLPHKIIKPHREEGVNVKVIVHPPKTPEGLRDLQKKVAIIHAEAVLKYLTKLPCPKEQKIELVASIQNSFKD